MCRVCGKARFVCILNDPKDCWKRSLRSLISINKTFVVFKWAAVTQRCWREISTAKRPNVAVFIFCRCISNRGSYKSWTYSWDMLKLILDQKLQFRFFVFSTTTFFSRSVNNQSRSVKVFRLFYLSGTWYSIYHSNTVCGIQLLLKLYDLG